MSISLSALSNHTDDGIITPLLVTTQFNQMAESPTEHISKFLQTSPKGLPWFLAESHSRIHTMIFPKITRMKLRKLNPSIKILKRNHNS
ncbi:hypothetical protein AQUCO_00900206v1 [Aquilegia coerulea]|uniref:Uncharacterized protein n=1 Tax=Aquilegia coerulea TaxID=218851 RepID=A0A2G5ECG2_AQUCA|nr:hypothetical protein AQUCO_00900206v1 [Aquilegia coerulea]